MTDFMDSVARLGKIDATIIDALPDPFFIKDRSRRILVCNSATAAFFGARKEDIVGRRNADLFSGETLGLIESSDIDVMEAGTTACFELVVPDHTGSPRAYTSTKSPLRDASGLIVGLVGYADEITGRRWHSDTLRLALRAARAATWDWKIGVDPYWSPEYYELHGIDPSVPSRADEWLQTVHPEDRARVQEILRATCEHQETEFYSEFRIVHPQRGLQWLAAQGTIYYDPDGNPVRLSGINYDITAKKNAEDILNKAKLEAERANQCKTNFLAAASHDLRQPLQSAIFYAASLASHLDETGSKRLEKLEESLRTLQGLLDSLLDISRLDSGSAEVRVETFLIDDVLDQIRGGLSMIAAEKGLAVRAAYKGHWVQSDRALLGRILFNLVDNAIKYTDQGWVEITAEARGGHLVVTVRDSGIGIGEHDLDLIWNEFHQIANPERDRRRGLGLGLSIVQRLAAMLDHPITVESRLGQGSAFSVTVPLGIEGAAMVRAETRIDPDRSGLCLLLDDDPIVLSALDMIVREWGYDTIRAETLDGAMRRLAEDGRVPDAIIADYRLRGNITGITAIEQVHALFGIPIPALIVTGDNDPGIIKDAAARHIDVLLKPVSPQQLFDAMDRIRAERPVALAHGGVTGIAQPLPEIG